MLILPQITLGSQASNLVTTLYTGTNAARDIETGQNLAGGGLVWIKARNAATDHQLFDTERGVGAWLESNTSLAEQSASGQLTTFNSNGFSLGNGNPNSGSSTYAAWSFLQKAGFMDIVEYSGDESAQTLSHNLGVVPGMMLTKRTDNSEPWYVYHKDLGETKYLALNTTAAAVTGTGAWNDTAPTSSQFTIGTDSSDLGTDNFITYLFAHNPSQGIECGSFTTDGSALATVSGLAFSPKFVLLKVTDDTSAWYMFDTERGWGAGNDAQLNADTSAAESTTTDYGAPTSDGFTIANIAPSKNFIYMAIKG